ncbi:MAG: hypothetical protein WCS37_04830 [Chloroflexota bacterium]
MKVHIEVGYDRTRALAHLLDYPGVCGQGEDAQQALEDVPNALNRFSLWLKRHGQRMRTGETHSGWLRRTQPVYEIGEIMACRFKDKRLVGPLFAPEAQPQDKETLNQALQWFDFIQDDIIYWIDRSSREKLALKIGPNPTERTANEVLLHIAEMDNWLTTRLYDNPASTTHYDFLKGHPRSYLNTTRGDFVGRFNAMTQSELSKVWTHDGEYWSASKVLRRAIFHRIDHLEQLLRLG